MTEPIISFKNFSFSYQSQQSDTLHDINLDIYPGEKILILGASGSGKSTLGNCINGLIPNQYKGKIKGSCLVNGLDITKSDIFSLSQTVGTVLQDSDAQFVGLNVAEDITFGLENMNTPRATMTKFIHKVAERVGILDQLEVLPYSLSGGQKQRVSVAGILNDENEILLLDEPLAALDPQMGQTMIELIDDLNKTDGKTVIMIEHRFEDVLHRSIDRVVLMDAGKIVAIETPDELILSNLLVEHGIREPLYISALKNMYGGLKQETKLTNLETINLLPYQNETQHAQIKVLNEQIKTQSQVLKDSEQEIINIDHIQFGYDDSIFINIDQLVIREGERIAIVGENGSGKTTLARLLTGVIKPQSGSIQRAGNPESIQEIAQTIGYVMQNPNQMLVTDNVFNEVAFALQLRNYSTSEIEERVFKVLKITGLYGKRNWPISALSYGQKKRLSVAVVLALEPKCLILDEPTAGQDYAHYRDMMEFVNKLNTEQNIAIIFITHDMHLALEYTDRALVIEDGQIIADAPTFEILDNGPLVKRASLKETSIFDFARQMNYPVNKFLQTFIQREREVYQNE